MNFIFIQPKVNVEITNNCIDGIRKTKIIISGYTIFGEEITADEFSHFAVKMFGLLGFSSFDDQTKIEFRNGEVLIIREEFFPLEDYLKYCTNYEYAVEKYKNNINTIYKKIIQYIENSEENVEKFSFKIGD